MVDLFFVKTFVAAAKTGSFKTAAARNHVSQPAVSQHIKTLESKLGAALFERRGRHFTLTPAGIAFLPYAESILKQFEEACMRVHESGHNFCGTIRLATIYSIGLYELQATIRKFSKKYPKVNIHLEFRHNAPIYEMVLNRTIDFGLVSFPLETPGAVCRTFMEDRLVAVQSPRHRVLTKKRSALKDLQHIRFIAFSLSTPTGKAINRFFEAKGIRPEVIHEYDNIELVKSAAVLGLGCAILPKNTIAREIKEKSLEVVPVQGLKLRRPLGILHARGKTFTKSMRAFYQTLTASAQTLKEPALRV